MIPSVELDTLAAKYRSADAQRLIREVRRLQALESRCQHIIPFLEALPGVNGHPTVSLLIVAIKELMADRLPGEVKPP